jgi:tRNA A-37 threonylcarbamoyl transferase component Bud32
VTGRRLIGQGAEAEVFEWREGRVVKLLRAHAGAERLAYEAAALDAARGAGVPVPRAYEQVVVDERPGLVSA